MHEALLPAIVVASHARPVPQLMKDTTLLEIARRLNKSPAQVCVRWALQRHPGTSLLFKSANRAHILENCEAATMQNWTLSAEDMKRLSNLPQVRAPSPRPRWIDPS